MNNDNYYLILGLITDYNTYVEEFFNSKEVKLYLGHHREDHTRVYVVVEFKGCPHYAKCYITSDGELLDIQSMSLEDQREQNYCMPLSQLNERVVTTVKRIIINEETRLLDSISKYRLKEEDI